jgi:hypothetical protein
MDHLNVSTDQGRASGRAYWKHILFKKVSQIFVINFERIRIVNLS